MTLIVEGQGAFIARRIQILRLLGIVRSIVDGLRERVAGHQLELFRKLPVHRDGCAVIVRAGFSLELIDGVVSRVEPLPRKNQSSKLLGSWRWYAKARRICQGQGYRDRQVGI